MPPPDSTILPKRRLVYKRPWLYPLQIEAMFEPLDCDGRPARFSCIEASTKAGKTVADIAWLFEQAVIGPKLAHHWWVAPVFPQAEIAFRRMFQGVKGIPVTRYQNPMRIDLPHNGACIWFKSGEKPDNLYGEDVHNVLIDEASRTREEAWHAVRSTLTATRGHARMIGNVKGSKNWFYRMSRKAQEGWPGFSYHRIVAADAIKAGILSQEEIDHARDELPHAVFRELYEAVASDDTGNPFGLEHIRQCAGTPLSPKPPVAWGWDLAKKQDWTVGIGLDEDRRVCRFHRFQRSWEDTIDVIRRESSYVKTKIDSTGVGDPIVERAQKGRSNIEGYHFTSPSKQQLMEGLAVTIQHHEVRFPGDEINVHPILLELESFEYAYTRTGVTYTAPEGMHDDCVCSLALADLAFKERQGIDVWRRAFN